MAILVGYPYRYLEALRCPRLKVGAGWFTELVPREFSPVSEHRRFVPQTVSVGAGGKQPIPESVEVHRLSLLARSHTNQVSATVTIGVIGRE